MKTFAIALCAALLTASPVMAESEKLPVGTKPLLSTFYELDAFCGKTLDQRISETFEEISASLT